MNQIIIAGLIIGIVALIFGSFYFFNPINPVIPTTSTTSQGALSEACTNSGGTVGYAQCCLSASDFPNNCAIGACGCSLENSHRVKICQCPEGECWNGGSCISNTQQTSTLSTTLSTTQTTMQATPLFTQTQSTTDALPPDLPS